MYTWFMIPMCFSVSFTCPLHIWGLVDMAWLVVWPIKHWHAMENMIENEDIFQLMDQASLLLFIIVKPRFSCHFKSSEKNTGYTKGQLTHNGSWTWKQDVCFYLKHTKSLWTFLMLCFFDDFFFSRTSFWNGNVICRGSEWSPRSTARSETSPRSWKGIPIHPASHHRPAQLPASDQLKIQFTYWSIGKI